MGESPQRTRRLVSKRITVPGNFAEGCAHFNEARFFECHESFEEVWQEERGPVRGLYKGLIQVAAGFVHLSRGNFIGADRLLRTGVAYLGPYRAEGAMGFDVETICRDTEGMHARLVAAGPDAVTSLDLAVRPYYAFDASALTYESLKWRAWGFDDFGQPTLMAITVAG